MLIWSHLGHPPPILSSWRKWATFHSAWEKVTASLDLVFYLKNGSNIITNCSEILNR